MSSSGRVLFGPGQEMGARMRPGLYYGAQGTFSSTSATQNRLYTIPFFVPRFASFDRIGVNVASAGTAGAVCRLGIYSDIQDQYGGYPGSLNLDAGTVPIDSTGWKENAITANLTPGLYWLAVVNQVAAAGTLTSLASVSQQSVGLSGSGSPTRTVYITDGVTGALPGTFTTATSNVGSPIHVQMRCSA